MGSSSRYRSIPWPDGGAIRLPLGIGGQALGAAPLSFRSEDGGRRMNSPFSTGLVPSSETMRGSRRSGRAHHFADALSEVRSAGTGVSGLIRAAAVLDNVRATEPNAGIRVNKRACGGHARPARGDAPICPETLFTMRLS
jgi:hypothetical protein